MSQMYLEYRQELFCKAFEQIHDYFTAEDIINEVFLTVIYHQDWWGRQTHSTREKYIKNICDIICREHMKKSGKDRGVEYRDDTFKSLCALDKSSDYSDKRLVMGSYFECLNERDRLIFYKRYVEEMPVGSIAMCFNMTEENVSQRLSRGRKKIQKYLTDMEKPFLQ